MSRVRWSVHSRRDVRRAYDYYRVIDVELALRIVDLIEGKAECLVDFPGTGTPVELGLRKSAVGRTPYLILYQEWSRGIAVSRVHHAAEDWR